MTEAHKIQAHGWPPCRKPVDGFDQGERVQPVVHAAGPKKQIVLMPNTRDNSSHRGARVRGIHVRQPEWYDVNQRPECRVVVVTERGEPPSVAS